MSSPDECAGVEDLLLPLPASAQGQRENRRAPAPHCGPTRSSPQPQREEPIWVFPLGRLLSLDCPADPDTWADANNGCGLLCSCTLLCPLGPTPPPFTGGCTSTNVGGSGIQTPSFVFGSDGSVFTASGVLNPVPGQVDRPGTGGGSDLTNADKAFIAAMIAAAALGAVLAVEVHHPQRRVGAPTSVPQTTTATMSPPTRPTCTIRTRCTSVVHRVKS